MCVCEFISVCGPDLSSNPGCGKAKVSLALQLTPLCCRLSVCGLYVSMLLSTDVCMCVHAYLCALFVNMCAGLSVCDRGRRELKDLSLCVSRCFADSFSLAGTASCRQDQLRIWLKWTYVNCMPLNLADTAFTHALPELHWTLFHLIKEYYHIHIGSVLCTFAKC